MLAKSAEGETAEQRKPEILVTSYRPSLEEPAPPVDRKVLRNLTREVSGRIDTRRPVARFHQPVCLGVVGIKAKFAPDFSSPGM